MIGALMAQTTSLYPVPGPIGGKLIRKVIAQLRSLGVELPIGSHILSAVSGGADSVALAVLLTKYGRRITERGTTWVHINHGWRGQESDADAAWVGELAARYGAQIHIVDGTHAVVADGTSPEAQAREFRYAALERKRVELGAEWILTAHHQDDQAETLLWRLFTGAARTHGAGILPKTGQILRPFLGLRRAELRAFLEEEGLSWREDRTNHEGQLLRTRMRRELLPALEALFPRAVEHLAQLGTDVQDLNGRGETEALSTFLAAAGHRLKRAHLDALKSGQTRASLPDGWELSRVSDQRWVIERGTVHQTPEIPQKHSDASPKDV